MNASAIAVTGERRVRLETRPRRTVPCASGGRRMRSPIIGALVDTYFTGGSSASGPDHSRRPFSPRSAAAPWLAGLSPANKGIHRRARSNQYLSVHHDPAGARAHSTCLPYYLIGQPEPRPRIGTLRSGTNA